MKLLLLFALTSLFYWFGKRMIGEDSVGSRKDTVVATTSFMLALVLVLGVTWFGERKPGSLIERSKYEGMYYVRLYPGDQLVKSYQVPAMISSYIESEDYGDRSYSWRVYQLHYVKMPNGQQLTFDADGTSLELDSIVRMFDDQGRFWGVQLTSRRVQN